MKAVVKTAPGYDQMEFLDIEEPKVYGDRIKIKVAYTGVCGSDIHTFKGEYKNPKTPVVLGHEFSGQVVEVGPDVTKFKVGDRVTSQTTFETCGVCRYCLEKDYNLCSTRKGIGTQQNGSFTEYVLSREESCHLLPDSVSYQAAALSEPLACTVHAALEKTTVQPHDTVLIIGPGVIGLLLMQVAKAQGAKVIQTGITKDAKRLALAKEIGADVVVDTLTEDLEKVVMDITDGYGVDKAFDCSGSKVAVNQALPLVAKKGTFVQVGLFAQKYNEIDNESIIQREIQYIGCRSQKPSSWPIALDLLANGKVASDKLITKVYDLKGWREAFETTIAGTEIKVMIKSNDLE